MAILLILLLGLIYQGSPPGADEILEPLSSVRLDKGQIHFIRDVTIRRDALTIVFNRGVIAFLEPVHGKVTGAAFIGSGEIVTIPPDPIERQQIHKFTGTPVLNETFQTAIFRFSDNTYEEVRKEISQRAVEEVSADDAAQFDSLEISRPDGVTALNLRLLADFLEPQGKPLFLGQLNSDRAGWFSVVFDQRAAEEVSVYQTRTAGTVVVADVWASFNQRAEARNPEAVAHENKAPVEILGYEIEGTAATRNDLDLRVMMRLKARTEGARVLNFDLAPALRVASVQTGTDEVLSYYRRPDTKSLTVVTASPLKTNQELALQIAYAGDGTGEGPWYPSQHQQSIPAIQSSLVLPGEPSAKFIEYSGHKVAPASYHDQWLVEGLTRYLAAMPAETNDPARTQLLKFLVDARDQLKPVESAGPIWLGPRLVSTVTPDAYRAVHAKGVWVIHMLRMMLRKNGSDPDATFLALLKEFAETYSGKAASTWDFRRVAEKHSGQKLDWFFDQWVFGTGLPSYALEYKVEGSGNQYTIEGKITQTGVPDGFLMPVPVYVDGEYLDTIEPGNLDEPFKLRVAKKPEQVVIDPEMTILTAASQ